MSCLCECSLKLRKVEHDLEALRASVDHRFEGCSITYEEVEECQESIKSINDKIALLALVVETSIMKGDSGDDS